MSFCLRAIVSGRVQGVFYRASTQQRAQQLGVTGSARNLPDGTVEVIACGGETEVRELEAWLWQGPPQSNVTSVESEVIAAPSSYSGFETG